MVSNKNATGAPVRIKDESNLLNAPDETLVVQVTRGNSAALELLYDRYAPIVLGISLKVVGDQALAEDVLQPGHGDRAGGDQLGERLARADRRELVGVADEHHVHRCADRAQERDQQLEVGHRRLIDDQQVVVELVLGRAEAGHPAQRGVHGGGVEAGRLGHPPSGAAGRGDERDAGLLRPGRRADEPDRHRLAGARAAGDDRQLAGEREADRAGLLVGEDRRARPLREVMQNIAASLDRNPRDLVLIVKFPGSFEEHMNRELFPRSAEYKFPLSHNVYVYFHEMSASSAAS